MPKVSFQLKKTPGQWRFIAEEKDRTLTRYKIALAIAVAGIIVMVLINLL